MDFEDDRQYVRNSNHILHIHILAPNSWVHIRSDGVARGCNVSSRTRVPTLHRRPEWVDFGLELEVRVAGALSLCNTCDLRHHLVRHVV